MPSSIQHAETLAREEIAKVGRSLFERGLTFGSTGNISVRLEDGGWLMTPTNASLGELDPATLSRFDTAGIHVGGDAPTKEATLHLAMYRERKGAGAVVHLHSSHSVAVSLLEGIDPLDVLLANHGPVVAGSTLANAQYAMEELEETAKLFLMLRGAAFRPLTAEQVAELRRRYDLG